MFRLFILTIVAVVFISATEDMNQRSGNNDIGKICKSMDCGRKIKKCPYGYQKIDGCEICKCYDPCNPSDKTMLCGVNKQCFVDKTINETFVARCNSLGSERNKDVYEQGKVVGLCKATFQRFYYDSITKKCKELYLWRMSRQ